MNGKRSEDQRIMSALKETLTLTDYPERLGSLSEEIYGMCLYADESEA